MPRYFRKVIRIRGQDSPNVRLAFAQIAAGRVPTGEIVLPGVLSYQEYEKRLATWDKIRVCVGILAEFYEGASVLMYPPDWLSLAEDRARALVGHPRRAKAIGIDPAEGGDKTAMAAVDKMGLIELVSKQTPDTSVVTAEALAFMRKHGVESHNVVFDRGGGGKQHADRLVSMGYRVRSVGFGEAVALEPSRSKVQYGEKLDVREERYAYVNRRAQMYGDLRVLLDPAEEGPRFALPAEYTELRRQLAPIPLKYTEEGRIKMLPKNKRSDSSEEETLTQLLGCSPDEADSLVLAVHGMLHKTKQMVAGPG